MKIFTHTFGCRVNQSEGEAVLEKLLAEGGEAVQDWRAADVCIVNTCTVTQQADRDALRLIRRIRRGNAASRLVLTGCFATRAPEELRAAAPEALIVGNAEKDSIPAQLGCRAAPAGYTIADFKGKDRAFVKVQDGCNMHCTYCIIPSVRPELSSKPYPTLEREVRGLLDAGYRELVLCGVRLGRYLDDGGSTRIDFVGMLERLLELPGDFRLRLSSFEVTDVTDRFLGLYARFPGRLCPYLHVPLQSGSDRILKAMERWYSAGFYRRRVERARERVPELSLFTDVMTAFPGETEEEHRESLRFIEEIGFSGLHPFRFSPREGTPAAGMPPMPADLVDRRARELRALDRTLRARFAAREAGRERTMLVERTMEGVTEHFLRVRLTRPAPAGALVPVRVLVAQDGSVPAEPLAEVPA